MPKLDIVSVEEAKAKSATRGKRAQILREYLDYIDQLKSGQAGRLVAGAGDYSYLETQARRRCQSGGA